MRPIHKEDFYHDGRGPELIRAIWSRRGTSLEALEYYNPEDPYDEGHLRHVKIVNPQVVMVTPEEVINYATFQPGPHEGAAAFDCGKSEWLQSFSPRHLAICRHYRLMFYDELYDIIAEGLEFRSGSYEEEAKHSAPSPQESKA
jgi:hypothetical protein